MWIAPAQVEWEGVARMTLQRECVATASRAYTGVCVRNRALMTRCRGRYDNALEAAMAEVVAAQGFRRRKTRMTVANANRECRRERGHGNNTRIDKAAVVADGRFGRGAQTRLNAPRRYSRDRLRSRR